MKPFLPACLLALLSGAASAAPLRDAATGLSVDPPPGYAAAPMALHGAQAARFTVRRPQDGETGCQVAFVPAPQNAEMTQQQLNQLAATPRWQAVIGATLAAQYKVLEREPYQQAGIQGIRLVADFRDDPRLPPEARTVRSLFVILETPRGRTTTVCVGPREGFAARQAEFLAVAQGVSPPP